MSAWVQRGHVYLWRYPEGPSGYCGGHLTADRTGCGSLDELLTKFIETPRSRSANVRVTRPTSDVLSVPNNRGGAARWAAPGQLRIEMCHDTEPKAWRFRPKGRQFELLAGREKLEELREAVRGIPAGEGDFALGPEGGSAQWDEMCLWIWWTPGAATV